MKNSILLLYLVLSFFGSYALNYSGIYAYNKGTNKASGIIYMSHFKEDSIFFVLQSVSGMPDFSTTEIKGFMFLEEGKGHYVGKDSCLLDFIFSKTSCIIKEIGICKYDFSPIAKYTRTSNKLKKSSALLPSFSDKKGLIKADSTCCLSAPNPAAFTDILLKKNQDIFITDEHNGFFLVEVKSRKNEFLWVSKKSVQLLKAK